MERSVAMSVAAGVLAGVAIGNYLRTGMLGSPPYYAGAGAANAAGAMVSSAAQASSRIDAIAPGVLGAWIADHFYRR